MPRDEHRPTAHGGDGRAVGRRRPPKPTPLRPDFERIPAALREHPRWVLWRLEWNAATGKWTKVPHRADGAGKASTTNPDTWSPFEAARDAYERGELDADGVGFVVGEGIVGGDVDACRDPATGELTADAAAIIAEMRTYAEVSPSGTGVRYFALGELPAAGRKRGPFEMYDGDGGRYLTVTGHQLDGTPDGIEPRDAELAAVHARHVAPPPRPDRNGEHHGPRPTPTGTGAHLSDAEVLDRMRQAKPAAAALYDGDTSAHGGDHSAADLALCSHLAFWCDYDAAQVDRLFRASGLMRPKWTRRVSSDGELYGERTIRTVMDGKRPGDGYHPRSAPRADHRPPSDDPGPTDADAPADASPDPVADPLAPLRLPPGYHLGDGCLTYATEGTRPRVVYAGHLEVTATGRTLEGEERLTVAFDVGAARRTVTAPRGALVRARGVLDYLGAAGANVHDANARDVGRYLSEYSALNADALPRLTLSERLGITPGGIIGPGWQVGEHVTYAGPELHALRIRSDRGAYLDGLRALASWEPSTWLPRAVLGLVAASPHLEHLHLIRNPVLGIGAPSNIGKGTAVAFAFGLYAEPAHPLAIQGIRTRTTALLQVFAQANGLPVWIDEAHKLDEHALVDGVYAFANRQTYARGGREGTARGGDPLRGALILTGEGLAELTATGARNRVLIVDGLRHYPLGRDEAPERVTALEHARAHGAGTVGRAATGHLWEHRATWTRDVHQLAGHLTSDAPTWHLAAAAAEVTIRYLYDALDLPADPGAEGLAQRMIAATTEGWHEVDPAREAFERVRDLVIAARATDGTRRARDGSALGRVVGTEDGTATWAVRSTAPEVEDVLKRYGGARVVAPLWKQRGYVRPDAQGKATRPAKLEAGEPAVRCYLFPIDLFDADQDGEPSAEARRVELGERPVN
jgi:hypothetical protein